MADLPAVNLYTDGACSGNPGPGGWAYILRSAGGDSQREASGGDATTTNNRMELQAVIEGLTALNKPCAVNIISDSKYVLNGLNEWLENWKRNGWKTASKKPVKNDDLWRELDRLKQVHTLSFHWIKGHSEHPENERCDQLAVAARDKAKRCNS